MLQSKIEVHILQRLHGFLLGFCHAMVARQSIAKTLVTIGVCHRAPVGGGAFVPCSLGSKQFFRRSLTNRRMSLEVEEKFQLSTAVDLEAKLSNLGFESIGTVTIVDWYFDNDDNFLSTKDCWLRFREKSKQGQWELKRGKGHQGTTVYEEIEGESACSEAVLILEEAGYTASSVAENYPNFFDGFAVPELPTKGFYGLRPFCRLKTSRSSWSVKAGENDDYNGLSVDLDATNTGHTVGEVEVLCDENEVEAGKQRVRALIAKLTGNHGNSDRPATGKLEHFLLNNRPDHYAACVASGVIQKTT